jgi:hypothetical protein
MLGGEYYMHTHPRHALGPLYETREWLRHNFRLASPNEFAEKYKVLRHRYRDVNMGHSPSPHGHILTVDGPRRLDIKKHDEL